VGTQLENSTSKFRCHQCLAKKRINFFSEVTVEVEPCCYRPTCNKHLPLCHKWVCTEHCCFYYHKNSMLQHEEQNSCKRSRTEYEAPPYPAPQDDDGYSDSDRFPPIHDNDDTLIPSSTHIFQSLPSFLLYQPTASVSEHFQSRPGRNLSNKSQTFFALPVVHKYHHLGRM
jgi:hypothetical protein